jgi:imidazolonepropionase-like amidohydrolase
MELLRERLASASKNGLADADLRRVARGEETVLLDCEGAELQAVLRLVSATGLDAGLLGVEDPTRSLRELVAAGRPVVLGPFELGARGRDLRAAAHLSAAGIDVAFTSAAPARSPEALRLSAALCIAQGMSEDAAFRALTTIPARLLGVADRVGTIERGRDADLVVWSGHPLDLSSRLEEVWIEGQRVFLAGDRQDASRRGLSSSRSGMGAREGRR